MSFTSQLLGHVSEKNFEKLLYISFITVTISRERLVVHNSVYTLYQGANF